MPTEPGPWRRRSERLSIAIPLYVSSLNPTGRFAEVCETISVNNHGCVIRFPKKVETGAEVRLDIPHTNRRAKARVVRVEPGDPTRSIWHIALELESAENFWGLRFPPVDWVGGRDLTTPPSTPPPSPPREAADLNSAGPPPLTTRNLPGNLQSALEEIRQTKARLETLIQRTNETLESRIQQVLAQRATQFESQLQQRWKEWAEAQLRRTAEAAKPSPIEVQSALEQLQKQVPHLAAQIADGVSSRLAAVWEEYRQKVAAAVESRLEEIRRTEKQLRELADRVPAASGAAWPPAANLRAQMEQLLAEQLTRARAQLDQDAASARARHQRELDEQLHKKTVQSVEQWVKVATAVEQRSRQWSAQFPQQEARMRELQESLRSASEQVSRTVESESERFASVLRERLVDATAQLKGQTQFAVEMAQSLAQDYRQRAENEITQAMARQLQGADEQIRELATRLETLRNEAEQSFRSACEGILKEATAELDVSTRDLSLRYIRTLEMKTSEILEAMAEVIRQRLRHPSPPSEGAGHPDKT